MKTKFLTKLILLVLLIVMTFSFAGCGNKDNSLDTPIEITMEYLEGEYSDQLIRDGAEITLGTVLLTPDGNGNYTVTTNEMVIVESDMSDYGYYIADKNLSQTATLVPEASITYIADPAVGPEIISTEDFAAIVNSEDYDPLKEGSEQLYEVYSIGGNVQLIMAKELPVTE